MFLLNDHTMNKTTQCLANQVMFSNSNSNYKFIIADILPENKPMQNLCQKLGFNLDKNIDVVRAVYQIQ